LAAKQKFSDAELMRDVFVSKVRVERGPSIKACARKFGVAYQSMSERVRKLIDKNYIVLTDYGLILTKEGEAYVSAIESIAPIRPIAG
jgi:Mn-dependent DtxR family transcriptional regulator